MLNAELKSLSLNKGHDFSNNKTIKFRHLNRGGLHVNQNGQKGLAMNFNEQIRVAGL